MAGLTTTQSFSDGDTVTAAKLNNIVSNCSIDDDAITTVKILNANVTLAKMATGSVDTGQLVADSVENSKLNDMAAKTIKANATNAGANPTDFPIVTSQLLAGTSDALKAVTFTTDLEMVDSSDVIVTDNTAADIRVADALISGKDTATVVPANDTVLVYDADGAGTSKLRKTTVTSMMQTLPATNDTSGVARIASVKRSVAPTPANGVDSADALGAINAGPMVAKAWIEFTSTGSTGAQSLTNSFNITSITQAGTGIYDIVFGNGGTDTKFDLPSDKYIVVANGYNSGNGNMLVGTITSRTATGVGCTVKFGNFENVASNLEDPTGVATLIFYGLTS